MLVAAYAPLLVLIGVLDSFGMDDGNVTGRVLRWAPAGVAALGVLVTVAFIGRAVRRRASEPEVVFEARPREGEAVRFFATYVVPFFVLQAATPTHRWALLVYLVLIAALYLQSEMFAANPVLALLGYRVFELNRSDGGFLLVLSRSRYLAPRELLELVPLGGYVYAHRGVPTAAGRGSVRREVVDSVDGLGGSGPGDAGARHPGSATGTPVAVAAGTTRGGIT